MLELRRMAEFLESDEEAFAELLAQKTDKELLREKKHDEEELQKAIVRNDTVAQLYEKLYEDNATGKVSDEWFMQLSHKYETERLELKAKIQALRQKQNPENRYLLPLCRVCGNPRGISKDSHQSRHPQRRCRGVSYRAATGIAKEQANRLLRK